MMMNAEWKPDDARVVAAVMAEWAGPTPSIHQQQLLDITREKFAAGATITAIEPVAATALEALSRPQQTEALRLLIVLTCLGRELTDAQLKALERLSRTLKQATSWPSILKLGRDGKTTRATMALAKWTPDGKALMRLIWKHEGPLGLFRAFRSTQGKGPVIPKLAARYEALGELPGATLGKAFITHMRALKLPMPGGKGGLPERAMHHDLMHVITGFDTTARGEGRLAGFDAGATERHPIEGADPFTFIMIGLMTFHLGYKVGPAFVGAELGVIDPREMMAFVQLGQQVPINILTEWNFAEDFAKPLTEVRAKFGIHRDGAMAELKRA